MSQVRVSRVVLHEKTGILELYNEDGKLLAVITDEIGYGLETIRIGVNTMAAIQNSRDED